jgi:hypothetical protein
MSPQCSIRPASFLQTGMPLIYKFSNSGDFLKVLSNTKNISICDRFFLYLG